MEQFNLSIKHSIFFEAHLSTCPVLLMNLPCLTYEPARAYLSTCPVLLINLPCLTYQPAMQGLLMNLPETKLLADSEIMVINCNLS